MKRWAIIFCALAACGHSTASGTGDDAGITDGGGTPDAGGGGGGDGGTPLTFEVKIRAVFPGSGPTSGGGTVQINGSGFVGGFALRGGGDVSRRTFINFAGTPATNISVIDDNRIELTVPAGAAGAADVVVSNPNGSGTCTGCYRYITPVQVSSVEPPTGPSSGGTQVTVHGDGFVDGALFSFAGRELIGAQVIDGQTATGLAPPGAAGPADVRALTRDGSGLLRRGFVYTDAARIDAVTPAVVPTAGGARISVSGAGFAADAQVSVDGAAQTTQWDSETQLELYAPPHAAGAVDVSAGGATLARGLVYSDGGALALYAVAPARGPVTGGITVHLYGAGLSASDLAVAIGGRPATAHAVSDVQVDVDLPAAAAPGLADVTVSAGGVLQTLAQAFRYDAIVALTSISPASGPAEGGTAVTLAGTGLEQVVELRIGAFDATALSGALSAVTPVGSPGPADVVAFTADGRTAVLAGGFTFTTALSLEQVAPALGAQAGGTRITLYGRGFEQGMSATIGAGAVSSLQVLSPTEATGLSPPGTPGAKPVTVTLGASTDSLPGAFTYFDPTSDLGGGTGGPLLGSLNVTVLEGSAYKDGGVQGALVQVVLHDGTLLQGQTDENGQITFSDDRLVLPAAVTATKESYDAVTVEGVATASLTVTIYGPPGPPPPPPDPPPPPPTPLRPANVGGHVFGFKLDPGVVLSATQRVVARVSIARDGVYALPPFSSAVQYKTVDAEGGAYLFKQLYSLDPTTFYAVFGIEDAATTPATFTPLLLGLTRGVRPNPDKEIDDADIILDTHLDQECDVTVLSPPSVVAGHDAFIDLDLGQAGAIPLDRVTQNSDPYHLHFKHLPAAAGQGFVFVDQMGQWTGTGVTTPVSTYLRRVFGDLSAGVTLGPLLPFPIVTAPSGGSFDGTIRWSTAESALQPNLQQLRVQDQAGNQDTSWSVLLPGDARSVTMSDPLRTRLATGSHPFTIVTSVAPDFDFAHWNYADLYSSSWTAYAFSDGSFTVP